MSVSNYKTNYSTWIVQHPDSLFKKIFVYSADRFGQNLFRLFIISLVSHKVMPTTSFRKRPTVVCRKHGMDRGLSSKFLKQSALVSWRRQRQYYLCLYWDTFLMNSQMKKCYFFEPGKCCICWFKSRSINIWITHKIHQVTL